MKYTNPQNNNTNLNRVIINKSLKVTCIKRLKKKILLIGVNNSVCLTQNLSQIDKRNHPIGDERETLK